MSSAEEPLIEAVGYLTFSPIRLENGEIFSAKLVKATQNRPRHAPDDVVIHLRTRIPLSKFNVEVDPETPNDPVDTERT